MNGANIGPFRELLGRRRRIDPGAAFVNSDGTRRSRTRPRGRSRGRPAWSTSGCRRRARCWRAPAPRGRARAAGGFPVPQVIPGVVEKLFQPLTLENLLLAGAATGNTSGTPSRAPRRAAPRASLRAAQAGVARSVLRADEPIKKIATSLQISDELIEDAPAIQTFINGRLALFVNIEAERQLLRGTSGGNEVQGLLTSRGVPVYAGGTAAGNRAVQLFKAMNGMRGSAFIGARVDRHAPHRLGGDPAADRHRRPVLRRRTVPGPYGNGSNARRPGRSPARATPSGTSRCTSRPRSAAPAPRWSARAQRRRCGAGAA